MDKFTKSGLSITRQAAFLLGKSINNKDIMLTATKNNIKTKVTHLLADTVTPVSIYLKVRDHFNNPVLLESNDFRSR